MEPLDPAKIDETSGFSKRRISSILKAPRKSIRLPEPEQQENVVECAKPGEKRMSRRVSFAPTNDVLLFSKDVKNASPVRSPLQDLTTAAAATENRVQLSVTEDGIQQIAGMETLLKAPLHVSQQRDKVNFDTGEDFGEKTVMFSTDDAFMDMTHSHTINIANDAELFANSSLQNYGVLPTGGEKTMMFTAGDGSMDMTLSHTLNMTSGLVSLPTNRNMDLSVETRNICSSLPSLDPGFENFLASLSKPSGPSINSVNPTRMTPPVGVSYEETNAPLAPIKTKRANVDKENQAPTSLNASRKIGESSYGGALCPEVDLSMDMTEAQTGHIQAFTDEDDDPFQCLFPTQEMYSHLDNRVSQTAEKTKQQQSSKTLASINPKDMTSLKNPSLHAPQQRQKVNLDTKDERREKTIMFTAGDEFMDMTQSHTVNIASGLLAPPNQNVDISHTGGKMDNASSLGERKHQTCGPLGSSANGLDPGFKNFLASLSKTSAPSCDLVIARMVPSSTASSKETVDTNRSLSQIKTDVGKENRSLNATRSFGKSFNGGAICTENDVSMDMTEAQTGRIIGLSGADDPFQFIFPHGESLKTAEVNSGQKFREVLGSSKSTDMETSLKQSLMTNVQKHQVKCDPEDDCREKTVRFSADDGCMDVTQSHTVNIATNFELHSHKNLDILPSCGEKTVRFTANDATMDITKCLTVNIDSNLVSDSVLPVKKQEAETCGLPRNRYSSAHGLDPVITRMTPTTAQAFNIGDSSNGETVCPEDDVSMDMTEAQTGRILGITGADDPLQCLFLTQDMYPQSGHLKKAEIPSRQQHSEALGSCNRKGMETSLSASVKTKVQRHQVKFDAEDDYREKTVRFTADDACMDVTRSHTVNIATSFEPQSHQNLDILPTCGEKTVRFSANDAAMDVTRSHTVNIATNVDLQSHQNLDTLPTCGEKTVRFSANDAAMDVTRSHTVNIATSFELQSHQNLDILPTCGEKTVRFSANDAAMDVTRSHTVNIATNVDLQSHQNLDILPTCGEKTVKFTANDAAMDMTQCLTVNIASTSVPGSVLPCQDSNSLSTHENMDFPLSVKKRESEPRRSRRNRSSSAYTLDPGFKNSMFRTSGPWSNPVMTKAVAPAAPSPQEPADTIGFLEQLKMQKPDVDTEEEAPGFVSAVMEKPQNKTMIDYPEDDVSMDMTEAQTGHILGQMCTDEPPLCFSSTKTLYPNSDHLKKTSISSQPSSEALGSPNPGGVEITNCPDSLASKETDARKEPEPRNQTSLSQKMESSPSAVDHDVDAVPSRKSRRMSLADLHSKVRRLSHMINAAPDAIAMNSCTAPMPQLERSMDKNSKDKTKSLHVMEPEFQMGLVNTEENTQAEFLMQGEQPSPTTTPFNLRTKQLMSRLSVGGFKPKLPQRSKPDDPIKVNSAAENTRTITVNVTHQLNNFDGDVSDINDEELGSCEDMSEMLDTRSPQRATEKVSCPQEFNMEESLEDDAFEQDFISAVQGKKTPLPVDENDTEDERIKAYTQTATDFELGLQSHIVECDGNITTAPSMTTQSTDYSNSSHTASIRCEATFESTFKQSLFESQLEDYANDIQRKFDDGTITVLEFFKLFNIDFVIHNPRQSVLPGRLLSDTDRTPLDLLKDRHINRPKQMVYETNVLDLTEKVEGLKERMRDLDRPLKIVNRPLWEEMRNSSEKELKSFGAKLKERNNLFRKMSKAQSHEMKEVLYSNLVLVNLEEQQRLRGTIDEADEMIKSLDDCILELETEIAAVEEKGFENTPSLKSRQEEMQKVTEALADSDRQISELEMQKEQNSKKLNRLKAETRNLESHVTVLHTVNEWKFEEKRDNCVVYTFLHETVHLQLVYEKFNGNDTDNQPERKISDITFTLQLDDEKSQGHACLVHRLLSQFIEGEAPWVEKYPTSRHVPKLLHDVGLVVSRCRLLGEELRLLEMWGGLRLDILNISCVDTRVHIVFSSLKKFSKFEVIFSVSLTNHVCVLQVQSFKNVIGSTAIQQIEEIVASFSPAKNLLTKIVKKIHEKLLC